MCAYVHVANRLVCVCVYSCTCMYNYVCMYCVHVANRLVYMCVELNGFLSECTSTCHSKNEDCSVFRFS